MGGIQSEDGNGKYHPFDIRPLIENGTIQRVSLEGDILELGRDVLDVLFPRLKLKPVEQAVYLQLYSRSYGHGLNCAQVSSSELCELCNISHSTVHTTIQALCAKNCVQLVREAIQHDPPIYRVRLASEALEYEDERPVSFTAVALPLSSSDQRVFTFAELYARAQSIHPTPPPIGIELPPIPATDVPPDAQPIPGKADSDVESRDDGGMI